MAPLDKNIGTCQGEFFYRAHQRKNMFSSILLQSAV